MARSTTASAAKTSTTKTAKKTSTSGGASAAAQTDPSATEPVVVAEATPVVTGPELKKAELVNTAVERSGIKKRYAKPAIEAALAILGEALTEGRALNLAPMGKAKVLKSKDVAGGRVLTTRIRQNDQHQKESDETPLAEPAE